ncbi:AraC family transcriptional regulator [Actinocrispum sp. NPDC049592]|uniref:AraC family transcriptional regulator n=1 Tax=Actinocrispum sp. NPDC049592 TaxID=3154835 RepID=UPI00343EA202
MRSSAEVLDELRCLVSVHARPDMRTAIDCLAVAKVGTAMPEAGLTEPLLVVLVQGGKRILLGGNVFEYRAGQCLLATANLPITGNFLGATPEVPAMGLSIALRAPVIAPLLREIPAGRFADCPPQPAIATCDADVHLLDALVRMVGLLDHPDAIPVLAPMIEREILWRLLTGPLGAMVRQVGLADSGLSRIGRVIQWIRDNYAEPIRIADLARLAGMSESALHRHFRAITALSPVQYQKRIRLQEARALLIARAGDVAGVAHLVGYESASQFSREYRRLFDASPAQDALRLRADGG